MNKQVIHILEPIDEARIPQKIGNGEKKMA